MNILSAFGFKQVTGYSSTGELPETFPLSIDFEPFVKNDLIALFSKILTDCLDRTQGIQPKWEHALWDNCLASEGRQGLVTLIAEAMADKEELFLVYSADVLRRATDDEEKQIEKDYATKAMSEVGVFISFKNYRRSEVLAVYSGMEYAVLNALHKTMNLAKAVQFKMSKMRETVGLVDSSLVVTQATAMAKALSCGKDVMMDGDDEIMTSTPDLDPTKAAIGFLDAKRAFILNLPLSYVTGEQTPGIGSTGEADTKAVERGLRSYWIAIIKPTIKALFGVEVTFKSQDFRMITAALEALKTFDLISNNVVSLETKRALAAQLLNVKNDMEGKPDEAQEDVTNGDSGGSDQNSEDDSAKEGDQKTPDPKVNG